MTTGEMKNELFTVRQVARLAGVGIKTLHHYDAIGLLPPEHLSLAGYRLYGRTQLEALQQILFYRELGFPLKIIHNLMNGRSDRLASLREQRDLIRQRRSGLTRLLDTIDKTLAAAEGGPVMSNENLFEGFHDTAQWNAALTVHNDHLKSAYGVEIPPVTDASEMNAMARHAIAFQASMADALRNGQPAREAGVQAQIQAHLAFLNANGHETTPEGFVVQTQFFMDDDFHRAMMEGQQTGLSYYLNAAARAFAA